MVRSSCMRHAVRAKQLNSLSCNDIRANRKAAVVRQAVPTPWLSAWAQPRFLYPALPCNVGAVGGWRSHRMLFLSDDSSVAFTFSGASCRTHLVVQLGRRHGAEAYPKAGEPLALRGLTHGGGPC